MAKDSRRTSGRSRVGFGTNARARLRRCGEVFLGLLRELSDQSAYGRHLAAHGRVHSPAEWRTFSDARLKAKYERAKCC